MANHSIEYPKTVPGIKRGLRAIGYSQSRAATETDQSPALVSMVLAKKARSQPCLDRLYELIAKTLQGSKKVRSKKTSAPVVAKAEEIAGTA